MKRKNCTFNSKVRYIGFILNIKNSDEKPPYAQISLAIAFHVTLIDMNLEIDYICHDEGTFFHPVIL